MTSLLNNTRRPDISFYSNGRIDITARVVKALGIERGDVIDVATDDSGEYLLYIAHKGKDVVGVHEAQCYPTNQRLTHNYRANSKRLCEAIRNVVRPAATGVVATDPLRLPAGNAYDSKWIGLRVIPLITRNPL